MTGYVRKDTTNNIADGNVINAADLDSEFDGVQAAFNASTGHKHDGTASEGATINSLGPTQDVTISASLVAPKTTNFVDIGSSGLKFKDMFLAGNGSIGGTLAVTGVATFTAQPILSSLTASRAVFSDGSKGLVSNAITGTGNVVMSASPTLTGTVGGASLTLSSLTSGRVTYAGASGLLQDSANLTFNGTTLTANTLNLTNALGTTYGGTGLTSFTANGVVYASSTSALATGSALTFDGSYFIAASGTGTFLNDIFQVSGTATKVNANGVGLEFRGSATPNITAYNRVSSAYLPMTLDTSASIFSISGSEQMRLTSTGLGIGTSSPAYKLDVTGTSRFSGAIGVGTTPAEYGGLIDLYTNANAVNTGIWVRNDSAGSSAKAGIVINASGNSWRMSMGSVANNNNALTWEVDVSAPTTLLTLTTSGNLGLGVTPSAWGGSYKAFEFGSGGSALFSGTSTTAQTYLTANAYFNGTNWIYKNTAIASYYEQAAGQHQWYNAPSGTAGNAITFTQAMTLTAAGNLGIGITNPDSKLYVQGSSTALLSNQTSTFAPSANSGATSVRLFNDSSTTGAYTSLEFWARNANSNVNIAYIASPSISTNDTGTLIFGRRTGNSTSAESMRIDSSGNLGLGVTPSSWTVSATAKAFEIGTVGNALYGFSGSNINLTSGAYYDSSWKYAISSLPVSYYNQSNGVHQWYNAPSGTAGNAITFTQAMTLDASGNFVVGATVAGNVNNNAFWTSPVSAAGYFGQNHVSGTASGREYAFFAYDATVIGSITQSGTTAVLYNTTSDQRLKENIQDAAPASVLIDSLQVRQYDWKSDGSHQRYGFVAQELVTVAPEAVHQPTNPEEMMAVDYSKLVPMLVKEIQSLRIRIAQLEAQ